METLPNCPVCEINDRVEKVEKVVDQLFSTTPIEGAEPVQWNGKTYYVPLVNIPPHDQPIWNSSVSGRLAFPRPEGKLLPLVVEPQKPRLQVFALIAFSYITLFLVIALSLLWFGKKHNNSLANWIGGVLAVLVMWGVLLNTSMLVIMQKGYHKHQKERTRKQSGQQEAEAKWRDLYYCHRDKGVFSVTGSFTPVEKLDEILFA